MVPHVGDLQYTNFLALKYKINMYMIFVITWSTNISIINISVLQKHVIERDNHYTAQYTDLFSNSYKYILSYKSCNDEQQVSDRTKTQHADDHF